MTLCSATICNCVLERFLNCVWTEALALITGQHFLMVIHWTSAAVHKNECSAFCKFVMTNIQWTCLQIKFLYEETL
jgi:hypothetical protein